MSAEDDALREMARNRGCRLVKSRRRKPGGDFGRYGLKDAKTGNERLGFGARGLTATADEIRAFLRGDTVAGWKRSLIAPVETSGPPAKRRPGATAPRVPAAKPPARAGRSVPPAPKAPDAPTPPRIREAKPGDAEAVAALLAELGYDVGAGDVRKRLAAIRKAGEPALVAERDRRPIACLSWHVTPVLHRPRPVGRITMLVVAESERGAGIGAALVAAAEQRLREAGCGLVEVTSNIKRMRAHGFYERLGYARTSYRFGRELD